MLRKIITLVFELRIDPVFSRYRLGKWARFLLGCFVAGTAPSGDKSSQNKDIKIAKQRLTEIHHI
jgi:hypothetical protein